MTKREEILKRAEAFVKTVVEHDFKQNLDHETLRAAALKASKAIPVPRSNRTASSSMRKRNLPVLEHSD